MDTRLNGIGEPIPADHHSFCPDTLRQDAIRMSKKDRRSNVAYNIYRHANGQHFLMQDFEGHDATKVSPGVAKIMSGATLVESYREGRRLNA